MSKFLKVMLVLVVIAAMATPVIAEDRLSLSGTMRVRAFTLKDYDFNATKDDTTFNFDQRLRVGGKIAVAEGVSITFRTDITERAWGDGGSVYGAGRMPQDGQQWDRAHIDLKKGMVSLRAGQQLFLLGNGIAFDHQNTGFKVGLGTAAPITLIYSLYDDRGSKQTSAKEYYGANIGHKTDNYSADIFGVFNSGTHGMANYVIGVDAATKFGGVGVKGEIDFFGGDFSSTVDAKGMNVYLDASMAMSETFTLGGQFLYGQSADNSKGEVQISRLGNGFNGWSPETYGPFSTDFEGYDGNFIFDFTGNNAGVIAFQVYSDVKMNDATDLSAALMYAMPEDDKVNGNNVDSAIIINAGVDYALMANTKLAAQVNYISPDAKVGNIEDALGLALRLQVAF